MKKKFNPTIAPTPDQVRAARTQERITQREAAEMIGSSPRTWEEWESGRRNMPLIKWHVFIMKCVSGDAAGVRLKRKERRALADTPAKEVVTKLRKKQPEPAHDFTNMKLKPSQLKKLEHEETKKGGT